MASKRIPATPATGTPRRKRQPAAAARSKARAGAPTDTRTGEDAAPGPARRWLNNAMTLAGAAVTEVRKQPLAVFGLVAAAGLAVAKALRGRTGRR